jgi:hypothetical protein
MGRRDNVPVRGIDDGSAAKSAGTAACVKELNGPVQVEAKQSVISPKWTQVVVATQKKVKEVNGRPW